MALEQYDLIVVGTGIASVPARKCAQAGWRVALVDSRPPGGTCALRGCTPKKMLRSGAAALDMVRRMQGCGVEGAAGVTGNWNSLVKFKDSYTDPIPVNNRKLYEGLGIHFCEGHARFLSEDRMCIDSDGAEPRELQAKHIVLATGARPSRLEFPGAELAIVSDDFINLPALPPRIAFIGGGFISMEFAHIAARYGAMCTIIHPRARPLSPFDPDLVDLLCRPEKEAGTVRLPHARVQEIIRDGDVYTVVAQDESGNLHRVEADLVVHGAGRVPNLDGLDLELGNVAVGKGGVQVDEYLRSTSNPRVYAAGDCADSGAPHLSLVASVEGVAVARNLLEGNTVRPRYPGITAVAFTIPAIASCGFNEKECHDMGLDVEARFLDTTRWFTNRHTNEQAGGYKILIEKGTDRLLGAHFLGHHCEEFINLFSLAIHHGMKRSDLKGVLYAHPSAASDLARILG